ncbi:LOB domain-containing protein 41 [Zea mays]|uniref:LOB domain-containing protein 41 n=2 Tax=Zea mays TaxID=4577 RepID=A0A3L6D766_MAIZE|nr:LOB domain-containing protein 41 [Zea mays]PWZ56450.1 LOB domain-containing protein 41 [Zea mays]
MRMSCNGCRVLRKGCSDACTIRPCLQWIKSPEAQANATVFLAKFYGRAGLLNLLAAPPADHLRPAAFRSLLYEACGRIVNPVYGSVGLLWSGQWQACQAAVEAVLKGDPVVQVQVDAASDASPPLLLGPRRHDIRHVARDPAAAPDVLLLRSSSSRRKRAASSSTSSKPNQPGSSKRASLGKNRQRAEQEPVPMVVEHGEESAGSHDHDRHHRLQGSEEDTDVEAASHAHSHVSQAEPEPEPEPQSHAPPASSQQQANQDQEHQDDDEEEEELALELTLGLEPLVRQRQQPKSSRCDCDHSGLSAASSLMCLRLQLPA